MGVTADGEGFSAYTTLREQGERRVTLPLEDQVGRTSQVPESLTTLSSRRHSTGKVGVSQETTRGWVSTTWLSSQGHRE